MTNLTALLLTALALALGTSAIPAAAPAAAADTAHSIRGVGDPDDVEAHDDEDEGDEDGDESEDGDADEREQVDEQSGTIEETPAQAPGGGLQVGPGGDNTNQCAPVLQGNTGNVVPDTGNVVPDTPPVALDIAPENVVSCDQAVNQAAAQGGP
jgi:hypothetical protein